MEGLKERTEEGRYKGRKQGSEQASKQGRKEATQRKVFTNEKNKQIIHRREYKVQITD